MLETVSINAERLRHYEFEHGRDEVEMLLDAVLSIQEHIDNNPRLRHGAPDEPIARRRLDPPSTPFDDMLRLGEDEAGGQSRRFGASPLIPRRICCCSWPITRQTWSRGSAT